MVRVAALDLGTNTFRLLVAEVVAGSRPGTIRKAQIITRLGGGFDKITGRLSPDAIERAGEALRDFAAILKNEAVACVNARATEIVRKASNGPEFLDMAGRLLGTKVKTLPPEEEALLAWKGIMAYNPPVNGTVVTLDVGGGSTELLLAESDKPEKWVSLPLGAVDLSERVLGDTDPPSDRSLSECETEVREHLKGARKKLGSPEEVGVIIGTGGTATSLAVVDLGMDEYNEEAVQNHWMSIDRVGEIESRLIKLNFKERGAIFPLGGGREDVIIPGAIITRVAMETFGTNETLVSDAGLLEGLAMAGADWIRQGN